MSMYITDTFCPFTTKCHFQELLRFVRVRQYSTHSQRRSWLQGLHRSDPRLPGTATRTRLPRRTLDRKSRCSSTPDRWRRQRRECQARSSRWRSPEWSYPVPEECCPGRTSLRLCDSSIPWSQALSTKWKNKGKRHWRLKEYKRISSSERPVGPTPPPPRGGGHFHYWRWWGRAAGQGMLFRSSPLAQDI